MASTSWSISVPILPSTVLPTSWVTSLLTLPTRLATRLPTWMACRPGLPLDQPLLCLELQDVFPSWYSPASGSFLALRVSSLSHAALPVSSLTQVWEHQSKHPHFLLGHILVIWDTALLLRFLLSSFQAQLTSCISSGFSRVTVTSPLSEVTR